MSEVLATTTEDLSIADRICAKYYSHFAVHQEYPTRVYLGRNEMFLLKQWAYRNGHLGSVTLKNLMGGGLYFNGLLICEVAEDTHFNVV